jgi:hypothetical protein
VLAPAGIADSRCFPDDVLTNTPTFAGTFDTGIL